MTDESLDFGLEVPASVSFEPVAAGQYDFVIHAVIGLGRRKSYKDSQGKTVQPKTSIKVLFELPGSLRNDEQPELVSVNLTTSLHGKSGMYQLMFACFGTDIIDSYNKQGAAIMKSEYASSLYVTKLIGKTGQLTVTHRESKNGNTYASVDIGSIRSLDPRLPKPVPVRDPLLFSPMQPNIDTFHRLTYWTQKEIMDAENVSSFPTSLHDAWVKIQEEKAKEDGDKPKINTGSALAGVNTASIE